MWVKRKGDKRDRERSLDNKEGPRARIRDHLTPVSRCVHDALQAPVIRPFGLDGIVGRGDVQEGQTTKYRGETLAQALGTG